MPTSYIKKVAKEKNLSISNVEKKWSKAKNIAANEGKAANWAYITGIFKKLIKENIQYNNSSTVMLMKNIAGILTEKKILSNDEINMWNTYIPHISNDEIENWIALNITPDIAKKFIDIDIDINTIKQWRTAEFNTLEILEWINYGFDLNDAIYYSNELHMSPTDALDYIAIHTNKDFKICIYKTKKIYNKFHK